MVRVVTFCGCVVIGTALGMWAWSTGDAFAAWAIGMFSGAGVVLANYLTA